MKPFQRKRKGKIGLGEARTIFEQIAMSEVLAEACACPVLERARYWNWFRIGYTLAQTGKITVQDQKWVKTNPWPISKP